MGRISGRVIGTIAGGALAIGGATVFSQLDKQTDQINLQVEEVEALVGKVTSEIDCYVAENCAMIIGTEEEYQLTLEKYDAAVDEYNETVDAYNAKCTGKNVPKSDEQVCVDLNNQAVKAVDALTEIAEDLDARIEPKQGQTL